MFSVRRCQKEHHQQHVLSCKEYAANYQHCVVCNRTVDAKPCTTCYKEMVCRRAKCVLGHHGCTAPKDTDETAVVVVASREHGELSIPCFDGGVFKATMQNMVSMMISMKKITVLVDRPFLLFFTFGGLLKEIPPNGFPPEFKLDGPVLAVECMLKARFGVCEDGCHRSPVGKLTMRTGGVGPAYGPDDILPLVVGTNILKLVQVAIPLSCVAQPHTAGRGAFE